MKKRDPASLHFAAIDIGSNAVRLLIKSVDENAKNKFAKQLMVRFPLRLGFDVFSRGKISEKKEKQLLQLMKSFKLLMKVYETDAFRACATSAMRDAKNGKKLIEKIEKSTGIGIEIIDGKEEARIIYNNHLEYVEDRKGNYMYVDVGGGSTEINFLSNGKLLFSQSYNIGTVRMLNGAVEDLQWKSLKNDLEAIVSAHRCVQIIGSGGNINKYYRLAEKKDDRRLRMTVSELQRLYDMLKPLPVRERMDRFDLKPDRADVIVPAGEIFLTIASLVEAQYIYVPVIGLADGIVDELYSRYRKEKGIP